MVSTIPLDGKIPANGTITLNFDNAPGDLTVRASTGKTGKTVITGKTITINGPFTEGELALTITWANGEQTLNYTVTGPDPTIFTETEKTVNETDVRPVLTQSPFKVTDTTFTKLVLESESPVVVYFWADWCPPCKWMAPIIKEVGSENRETFLIAKLDTDRNRQTTFKNIGLKRFRLLLRSEMARLPDGSSVECRKPISSDTFSKR